MDPADLSKTYATAASITAAWANGKFNRTGSKTLADRGWDVPYEDELAYLTDHHDAVYNRDNISVEFTDNEGNLWMIDLTTGRLSRV